MILSDPNYKIIAQTNASFFLAHLSAGFSSEQAFDLTKEFFRLNMEYTQRQMSSTNQSNKRSNEDFMEKIQMLKDLAKEIFPERNNTDQTEEETNDDTQDPMQ